MNTRTVTTIDFQATPNDILTRRDTQALVEMAKGSTAKEMALALGVSYETARTYMGRVNEKLGVSDKAAAVCQAFCLGILKPLCILLVASQVMITMGSANQPTRPARNTPRVVRVVRSGRSVLDLSVIRSA
ncbi:response regulator transcription factor [Endozoicomonas ascidiicola]|uniref:response regulator transcription factor n=1 Tax=Endozoicomonas ascidiicola TaxID=1698521 RepID=UPI000835CA4D|nr:helix-turn-helix transcriptional regulator [Endozoicomonas ascidiicola]